MLMIVALVMAAMVTRRGVNMAFPPLGAGEGAVDIGLHVFYDKYKGIRMYATLSILELYGFGKDWFYSQNSGIRPPNVGIYA
jgi:hypothetical protein